MSKNLGRVKERLSKSDLRADVFEISGIVSIPNLNDLIGYSVDCIDKQSANLRYPIGVNDAQDNGSILTSNSNSLLTFFVVATRTLDRHVSPVNLD
jgi:hypothetical protein